MTAKELKRGQNALLYIKERIKISWLYIKLNKGIYLLFSLVAFILIFNSHYKITLVELKNPIESLTDNSMAIYEETIAPHGTFYVTHYCSCPQCTGYQHGDYVIGAMGTELIPYKSCAAPSNIPFGTELLITHKDGTQETWVVQDRGYLGANHLDLYVGSNHSEALSIPNEYVEVQVLG